MEASWWRRTHLAAVLVVQARGIRKGSMARKMFTAHGAWPTQASRQATTSRCTQLTSLPWVLWHLPMRIHAFDMGTAQGATAVVQ